MAAKVRRKYRTLKLPKSEKAPKPEKALARLEKALDAANAALVELRRAVYPQVVVSKSETAPKPPAGPYFTPDPVTGKLPPLPKPTGGPL